MTTEPARRETLWPSSVGTPEQLRWLRGIVAALLVLNALDGIFTIFWIQTGIAEEANPLLRRLVEETPVLFTVTKLGLVGLGSAVLWRNRERPLAVVAIFVAFGVYYGILLWHLHAAGLVVGFWLVPGP